MALMFDARVPVAFGTASEIQEGDFLLEQALGGVPGHDAGCACCMPRTIAAETLGRLFMQRARGEVAFFRRVLVAGDAAAVMAVTTALRSDPVAAARFRLTCNEQWP